MKVEVVAKRSNMKSFRTQTQREDKGKKEREKRKKTDRKRCLMARLCWYEEGKKKRRARHADPLGFIRLSPLR